ncbi:MAG: WxcM-like domain-containing protein [Desulfobacteraceae bacterium]|jgi:dTDP-4-dehydrorhamnose 3,5-epimerase-like enzyme|nr:MAG: WxcM-like domain-containing protein [Desulfobacteraceae bacterium]
MKKTNIFDCFVLELNKHHSNRKGNISVVENGLTVPFDVRRVYYIYDVPGGECRGGHAHKDLYQLIIAASGSFDVVVDDGQSKKIVSLNRPYHGLLVVPGIWRELVNFSSGSVCLVLASELYDKEDYIYDYQTFLNYKKCLN